MSARGVCPQIVGVVLSALVATSPVLGEEFDRRETGCLPGDVAPAIQASSWLRGERLESYRQGHVYIVDLWASWCVPCLHAMPLLRDLDRRYEDLTVIAMNVWEFNPAGVPALVETLADSMPATIALDSIPSGKDVNEGLTALSFLGGSEMVSIPRTYLIDKQGRVAWIGTPHGLEEPLAAVLTGTWDLESHASEYARNLEIDLRYRRLLQPVDDAIQAQEWSTALERSEAVVAADPSFGIRIASNGFAHIALAILQQESPPPADLSLAARAVTRALELSPAPDSRHLLLGARVAKASGNLDEAKLYLERARRHASNKSDIPASVEDLRVGK